MSNSLQKHIRAYFDAIADYERRGATSEGAVRIAFQNLLDHAGAPRGLKVLAEQTLPLGGRRRIRVDGDVRDAFNLRFGIWEAKDTDDDLEVEVAKKMAAGYPTRNTIFEDTRRAVLVQDGGRRDFELRDEAQLRDLLDRFFAYQEPRIEEFHQAVREFAEQIPQLAQGLKGVIDREKDANPKFRQALEEFHELCRVSLNPATTLEEVEDMLRQHLLTERIFTSVFGNPDFARRNPIAVELEKVIGALTGRAFSRTRFLEKLDYFYRAIEAAARGIEDYRTKQEFLHTVYERFFQRFSTDTADTHGIVYTPEPIVKWMVSSVERVLEREFSTTLSAPDVHVLDPCVGTGTFMLELIERIQPSALPHKYAEELHCNEVLLLPYYIAAQNIEHEFFERTRRYEGFPGICFADTLDMGREQFGMFTPENAERVHRQERAPIRVIIGNPPYNVGQQNESDNNKNRSYRAGGKGKKETREGVDDRIRATYVKESRATLNAQLYDPYVRFFRWATDRLRGDDGVVCFVSNNSFLDQIAFDGMRKDLRREFSRIYVLDLGGNVRKNPKLSGTTHNVFGIQVGVAVVVMVRRRISHERWEPAEVFYARFDELSKRREKYEFLDSTVDMAGVEWQRLMPDERDTWLTGGLDDEFNSLVPAGDKEAKRGIAGADMTIFSTFSGGVKSNRDDWVYEFGPEALMERSRSLVATYNAEVQRWLASDKSTGVDQFVTADESRIKWSGDLKERLLKGQMAAFAPENIRQSIYRPYTKLALFFHPVLNNRRYLQHRFFPTAAEEVENRVVVVTGHSQVPFSCQATNCIACIDAGGRPSQCFPFYVYDEDGTNRRENITDWALAEYQGRYGAEVTKWDIFHYVYGLLHSPEYRTRYADNLKRDLPRIPFVSPEDFRAFTDAGTQLMKLHVEYEGQPEHPLEHMERNPFTWRVERMRLSPDRTQLIYNEALTLRGIPPEVYEYRLGNRSALEWVVDQYRVKTDTRSGITHDPNNPDHPEYIVRLVKRVVTVSVETVAIVTRLPPLNVVE